MLIAKTCQISPLPLRPLHASSKRPLRLILLRILTLTGQIVIERLGRLKATCETWCSPVNVGSTPSPARLSCGCLAFFGFHRGGWRRRGSVGGDRVEVGKVVDDAFVRSVLFVDLKDPRVFVVGRGENLRGLAREENSGVGALAINHASDDDHAARKREGLI